MELVPLNRGHDEEDGVGSVGRRRRQHQQSRPDALELAAAKTDGGAAGMARTSTVRQNVLQNRALPELIPFRKRRR